MTLATLHLIACGWYLMACEPGGLHDTKCYPKKWAVTGDRRNLAVLTEEIIEEEPGEDPHKRRRKRDSGRDHGSGETMKNLTSGSMFSTFMISDIDIHSSLFCFPALSYQ